MKEGFGVCPKCFGTCVQPAQGKYTGGSLPCRNCGGQTMYGKATGEALLRADGTPCLHSFTETKAGNCYYKYQCKHCPTRYDIDSGD